MQIRAWIRAFESCDERRQSRDHAALAVRLAALPAPCEEACLLLLAHADRQVVALAAGGGDDEKKAEPETTYEKKKKGAEESKDTAAPKAVHPLDRPLSDKGERGGKGAGEKSEVLRDKIRSRKRGGDRRRRSAPRGPSTAVRSLRLRRAESSSA